jgi:Na+-driven multidrug efflux pump
MVQQIGFAAILLFVPALQNTGRFYWLAFFEMFRMIIVFVVLIAVTAAEFQFSVYIVAFGRR